MNESTRKEERKAVNCVHNATSAALFVFSG
jgi:hypothetical protein